MFRMWIGASLMAAAITLSPQAVEAKPKPTASVAKQTAVQPALFAEQVSGVVGAPQPIVLIPGLTAPAAAWDAIRPALEQRHEVRRLTLAGMGGQPPHAWDGNFVEAQGKALVAHLRASGVKDATVVGHSIGGGVALVAALEGPDVIGRLIIVDSVPFTAAWLSGGQAQTPEQAVAMAEATKAMMGTGDWAEGVARNRAGLPIQSRDPAFYPQLEAWMLASDQATVATAMGDLLRLDLRARLAGLQQPTLVLMGYDQGFTPAPRELWLGWAKQQYAQAPNAEVRLIEGSRHWVQHDQPQALLAAMSNLLDR